jgi:Zn-dependent protease with chaperone function
MSSPSKKYQVKETMLVITVGFLVLYIAGRKRLFLDIALAVGVIGVFSFYLSEKIHWAWNRLSLLLGAVSNRVLLSVVFFLVLTPMALVRRMRKKDALRRFDKGAESNFSRRDHVFGKKDLENVWVFLLFMGLAAVVPARAQTMAFQPATEDSVLLARLCAGYAAQYKQGLEQLPSDNRKDYQELYTERWQSIKTKFDEREIYTSAEAQAYLDALTAEIVRANPVLSGHVFHCYFSRSYVPNAEYVGEGIILVNMGLFQQLHNESEAVFILCHEIAHYILKHQENSIDKYVTTINSRETQEELRRIKNSQYQKREALEQLVKGLTFDSRRHSRDHEAQADSMGVELMRHTAYDVHGALTALALLDEIDKDDFDTETSLQQLFNAPDYPFKKKWLNQESGLLGGHAHLKPEEMSDSLKTHPACKKRIQLLTPLVAKDGAGRIFVVDSSRFAALQERFRYEVIEYAYASGEYTESLFLTMELLKERPVDPYGIANTGRLLNGIYAAQKAHRASKVIDLPAPGYPENYNNLLQFIQNLYLSDLASINYYFLSPWHPKLDGYPIFRYAYDESAKTVQH